MKSPLGDDEAERLLLNFVAVVERSTQPDVTVMKESRRQHRAVARFRATNDDGTANSWLAFLVLWRTRFLICSCYTSTRPAMLHEAEEMFASIHAPRTRFFSRS